MGGTYVTVWLDGAGDELDRLARGPDSRTLAAMESALLTGFTMAEERVHVITGLLKASGHPQSSFDLFTWRGEMDFARIPGIFELARGDEPSRDHPEGEHYFMKHGGPLFERGVRQAVWDWVTDGKGGKAPSGGLGPYSGGD
jgi:hypothetical protein